MQKIVSEIQSWPPESHFAASFTEKPDDLSQWRAYSPAGLGVSIGFSTRCLQQQWIFDSRSENPSFQSAFLQKVRYYSMTDEAELEKFVEGILATEVKENVGDKGPSYSLSPPGTSLNLSAVYFKPGDQGDTKEAASLALIPTLLGLLSPFIKHDAFKDEAEWRKLISSNYRLMPGQLFRQAKSTLIPYVEVMLDAKTENAKCVPQETYFIDEVIVGPTPSPELTMEAVQALFASEGHSEVKVRVSNIPYRSW